MIILCQLYCKSIIILQGLFVKKNIVFRIKRVALLFLKKS